MKKRLIILAALCASLAAQTAIDGERQIRSVMAPRPAVVVITPTGKRVQAKLENITLRQEIDGSWTVSATVPASPQRMVQERLTINTGQFNYSIAFVPIDQTLKVFLNGLIQNNWGYTVESKNLSLDPNQPLKSTDDCWVEYWTLEAEPVAALREEKPELGAVKPGVDSARVGNAQLP